MINVSDELLNMFFMRESVLSIISNVNNRLVQSELDIAGGVKQTNRFQKCFPVSFFGVCNLVLS